MVKKICFQKHHPSRELFPNYTIRLRKWCHMLCRRLEQFNPTKENLIELERVVRSITWIYHLKQMEYETKYKEENNV
jgi:hypothetical protein